MARPLRIEFAGALYHVMSRGNEKRAIVRDDVDRSERLERLRRTVVTYGWHLHSFVLMTNHEHLFVETPEPNLSVGMQFLNGSYATFFNRRHRRVGHLLQGRFKSQLVETDGYFSSLSRYIHLNPFAAGLVTDLEAYPWSSYPGYHRATKTLPWVVYGRVLGEFDRDPAKARAAYRSFVRAGMSDPPAAPWANAVEGLLIGSDSFVQRVRKLFRGHRTDGAVPQLELVRGRPSLDCIVEIVARELGRNPLDLCRSGFRRDGSARALAAYLARGRFRYSARQTATALGYRSHGSVAPAVQRVAEGGSKLLALAHRLERRLTPK